MADNNLKQRTISALIWEFSQKLLTQLLSFAVTVILARLLLPEDYGAVALAGMFNILMGVFIDGGMGMALIQKMDADDLDYNTVFYSNVVMSFVIYAVVFLLAPFVADFYDLPILSPLIRVMAISMPIGALSGVHNAIISKRLEFKKFFVTSVWRHSVAAAIAIVLAYKGFGPWALAAQSIIGSVATTLALFSIAKWTPSLKFSWLRFRILFDFAWKKQAAGLLGTLCSQLKGYLIGYKYTAADLAFLNRGDGLPDMFMNNINGTINGVLFPALSNVNNDYDAVKRGIRRSMMVCSYVLCPLLFGLAAMANKIVPVLYSAKWAPAVPFMQVACLTCCMTVLNTANIQALLAIGRSDEVLRLEFYKKPVMLAILALAVFISPVAISFGLFVYSLYVLIINTIPNKKYIGYSIGEQINDVKSSFLLSAFMAIFVYLIGYLPLNIYILMIIQFVVGIIIYLCLSHFLKIETYLYVIDICKQFIKRR